MLTFIIPTEKNAVPYMRTTQKQKFRDKNYQRYLAWKAYVKTCFAREFGKYPHKVFKSNLKYYMDIKIYFYDKTHGDSDNVYKGINDSLFNKPLNDKYIAGSFDYFYDRKNPRVEINILTAEEKELQRLKMWENMQNAKAVACKFEE